MVSAVALVAPLAFLWDDHPPEEKIRTIAAHAGDLERALEELRRAPDVNGQTVVILAWSYGGQSAARLHERDHAVRGIISLDANVVPARPEESLVSTGMPADARHIP